LNAKRSQAAKDVVASQDILVDLFGRMESFFRRLEIYTGVPLTSTMTDKMVEITVEVLDILATATKELKQSRASEFVLRHTLLKTHIGFRKVREKGGGADGSRGWDEEAR
jgi:phosphate starvation-inducible protein PhoH